MQELGAFIKNKWESYDFSYRRTSRLREKGIKRIEKCNQSSSNQNRDLK